MEQEVPSCPVVRTPCFHCFTAERQIQSLVGELRSHKPYGMAKKKNFFFKEKVPWCPGGGTLTAGQQELQRKVTQLSFSGYRPLSAPFSTRRNYTSLEMLCLSQSHRRRREFTIMNYTVSHNCNRHCAKCSTGIISFNPAKTPQDAHYLLKKNGDIDGRYHT